MDQFTLRLAQASHKYSSSIGKVLPKKYLIRFESLCRSYFMHKLYAETPATAYFLPDAKWHRTLWGLKFQTPLMNSAGMFKNGEGYDLVAKQGAGGYLAGTSTFNPRAGNTIHGIQHPFISLAKSQISLNSLGLPNLGDEILASQIITQHKQPNCPIGWSVMRSSDYDSATGMINLIKSLWLYHDNPQIDFIELNESCPNVKLDGGGLAERLELIAANFLLKRKRNLPVILKLSNSITLATLTNILDMVVRYKFDGINLGNTATNYASYREAVDIQERALFDYFTKNYGGGIGGNCLKHNSLQLCSTAAQYIKKLSIDYEFHVIRTGGVNSLSDILQSEQAGISLNQWYTGYFTNYLHNANSVYENLLR